MIPFRLFSDVHNLNVALECLRVSEPSPLTNSTDSIRTATFSNDQFPPHYHTINAAALEVKVQAHVTLEQTIFNEHGALQAEDYAVFVLMTF